ncbi:MAG: rhodanese-like domain-containing protein [Pyrinomonadaceae bacterium]
MSECTVLTLNEKLSSEDLHLVDVREFAEYSGGRVAGAKLLPLGEIEKRNEELDHKKPIYVMCRTGNRSAQAQKKLKSLGFENVINVAGGFEAWKKEDLPFERDENAPWALERQVRFVAGLLVLTGVLLSAFVHPYFIWFSGLIGAGLVFAAATDTCAMGMVLLKMPWNRR